MTIEDASISMDGVKVKPEACQLGLKLIRHLAKIDSIDAANMISDGIDKLSPNRQRPCRVHSPDEPPI